MSRYVRSVRIATNHFGDDLELVLKPLLSEDLVAIRSAINSEDDDDSGNIAAVREYLRVLPAYVVSMAGFKDSEGVELGVEALKDAYWLPVVTNAMASHMAAVSPADPSRPGEL